jgi:ankyrin repeat protein
MIRALMVTILVASTCLATPFRAWGADDGPTKTERAWFDAARDGDSKKLEVLLGEVPIDVQDCEGNTALMLAVKGGHVQVVSILVDHRADCNKSTYKGATPLGLAVFRSKIDLVKLLLAGGANADQRGLREGTPLMRAARAGNVEVVTLLLDAGASVNGKSRDGLTALHGAASEGNTPVVKLLLKRGADPNLKTAEGLKAQDLARRAGRKETEAVLGEAGNTGRVIELGPKTEPPATKGK